MSTRPQKLRLFIATELPERILDRLSQERASLEELNLPVRWARPGGIHLTLQFLGDLGAHRVKELVGALEKAVVGVAPLVLRLDGLGAFPNLRRPRVVWVGVDGELEALLRLRSRVTRAMKRRGLPLDKPMFHPHLTLGRVRRGASRAAETSVGRALEERCVEPGHEWQVRSISLIRSELLPSGARYTPVGTLVLTGL